MTTFNAVREIIAQRLGTKFDEIEPGTEFGSDIEVDSLDSVELTLAMEDHFGIAISDEEVASVYTVGDAVKLIDSKL